MIGDDIMKFKMNGKSWYIKEISNAEMNLIESSDNKETFTHGCTEYSTMIIYINSDVKDKKTTLYHELCHCFMHEYGHNQWTKQFNHEDVCDISAASHDIIHKIAEDYFKVKGCLV